MFETCNDLKNIDFVTEKHQCHVSQNITELWVHILDIQLRRLIHFSHSINFIFCYSDLMWCIKKMRSWRKDVIECYLNFWQKKLHLYITLSHQTHKLAINLKSLIVFQFQCLCENLGPPDWILSNFETDSWKFATVKRIILPKLGSDEIVISHAESYDVTLDLLPIYRTNFTYISMRFVFLMIDKFGVWIVLR